MAVAASDYHLRFQAMLYPLLQLEKDLGALIIRPLIETLFYFSVALMMMRLKTQEGLSILEALLEYWTLDLNIPSIAVAAADLCPCHPHNVATVSSLHFEDQSCVGCAAACLRHLCFLCLTPFRLRGELEWTLLTFCRSRYLKLIECHFLLVRFRVERRVGR